ncbi:PAS domain S-box protein [Brevundimonas sp. DC300-4]|uniref:PAS domain S-box protein n=1 Tax=Brevundimonas sp. DC300-4 TaxID=2804594 RepID=UPI003CFB0B09
MINSESGRLAALRHYQILDTGPEAVFDRVTELAADLFGAPIALVSLIDEDRQWFKSAIGLNVTETPREQAFCAHTILSDDVMVVPDAELDARFSDNPLVLDDPLIRFYAGAPLRLASGLRMGSLCVIDRNPRPPLTPSEKRRLQILAEIVVSEMEMRLTRELLDLARQESERARSAIEEQEKLFHELADSSFDVVLKVSTDNTILYASSSIRRYGYDPDRLVGTSSLALIHPDDVASLVARRARLFVDDDRPSPHDSIYRMLTATGGQIWVEGNPTILRDSAGQSTALVTQLRDITERKAVEDALAASEARYRLLAENATDVIGCYGSDSRFTFVSPAIEVVLGYDPCELIGRNTADFMHAEDVPRIRKALRDYVAAGKGAEPIRFEYRAYRKDGAVVWLEGHPRAIFNEASGELVGFQDVVRDISQRKAFERELAAARDAAEAATAAKTEFLSNMSHELRSPLTSIIGFSGILGASPDLGEKDRRFATRIGAASNALLTIVNDVLDLARLESGHLDLMPEPTDAEAVAASVADMMIDRATSAGLTLVYSARPNLPLALVDSARLRQVVLNLVSNAVKFTERGGVTVSIDREADRLIVVVSDTGIGIAPDRLDEVFERFVQADTSIARKFGGTGLGLAISRRLAEQMGGEITVESVVGEGTTFRLSLPTAEGGITIAKSIA